eukprot:gene1478-4636_t
MSCEHVLDRFVDEVPERFLCPICQGVMASPVQGPCQHEFGCDCLRTWLSNHQSCPICNSYLTIDMLNPARLMRELIESLQVYCDHHLHGCDEHIAYGQIQSHIRQSCSHIRCRMNGCELIVLREHLEDHEGNCPHNPQGHNVRMSTLSNLRQDMLLKVTENLQTGVLDQLEPVERRLKQNNVRVENFVGKLDAVSIPKHDTIARAERRRLVNYLGSIEDVTAKLIQQISELKNCLNP